MAAQRRGRYTYVAGVVLLSGCLLVGCATFKILPDHPQQARAERLLAMITPYAKHPDAYYWVRVVKPTRRHGEIWVLPDRHIYVTERLAQQADDTSLTAFLAYAIAHYELHHDMKRSVVRNVQYVGFMVGSLFVPGLALAWFAADPLVNTGMKHAQDYAADEQAVIYLQRAGYSAEDYAHALQWLDTLEATHERYAGRIAAIRKRRRLSSTTSEALVTTPLHQ